MLGPKASWRRGLAATALLWVAGTAALAQTADDAALAEAGRRTYTSSCARCHGIGLVNAGYGFDLRAFPRDDKERFVRSVTKGLRAMPAWEGILKSEQIDALWAYILQVQSTQ
jgi:mono/diheme cytochrome c family protein